VIASLPDVSFWRGKSVLVTGHTGFKGSWLVRWLRDMGAEVSGLALAPDPLSLFNQLDLCSQIRDFRGDLVNRDFVKTVVADASPQIVFHLAAQPLVGASLKDPITTFRTNVMGTAHVLEALLDQPSVEAVIIVTTDKVYRNSDLGKPFVESDQLGGSDPYSASKACVELVTRSFRESYFDQVGIPVATARGGNVIGGGDYTVGRLVPDVVDAAYNSRVLSLRMPSATRPWQHVLDCLAGYLLFAERLSGGSGVPAELNFGPDGADNLTVETVVSELLTTFGIAVRIATNDDDEVVEHKLLSIDPTLAQRSLGWAGRLPGINAVRWTADWYRLVVEGEDPAQVTGAQVAQYLEMEA